MKRLGMVLVWLTACGGGGGVDAGMDGGVPIIEEAAVDTPSDTGESCEGMPEGTTVCSVDTRTCCGGYWRHYLDGVCLPGIDAGSEVDAGGPCSADPEAPGCPCSTEGAISCPLFRYRRVCEGGAWAEDFGVVCCSVIGY